MDAAGFLHSIRHTSWYQDQLLHQESLPPRQPAYGDLERPLDGTLREALHDRGLYPLYLHQAQAINALRRGQHVVVTTSAASGKSLCYHVPVLEALLQDPASRSLYLFPTKALAQDQLRSLQALCPNTRSGRASAAIYDGDSPPEARQEARRSARVLITNPDMLHLGILPNHQGWARLLRHLRYVVLDEAHVYRGIFGSHVANLLRRLRRLCDWYGSHPQFILCSATIANPAALAQALVGLPFHVVTQDGSPSGPKEFIFWNPPWTETGTSRKSATSEAASLMASLVRQKVRTLTFARTRRQVELIHLAVRHRLAEDAPALVSRLSPYRASYLPQDRRRIERALQDGHLLGVVSTNALELGIDIGTLDATILAGYPGTVSSTWQQAGRSGRRQEGSLSFLVARNNPLDQYLMHHPDFFFDRPHEHALISQDNPHVLAPHLLCAAYELPLTDEDAPLFGETLGKHLAALEQEGSLRKRGQRWFPSPSIHYPAQHVSLRSSSHRYGVVDRASGALLEEVGEESVFFQLHPGAVYLHFGEAFHVEELDLATRTAYVSNRDLPYYTQCRDLTDIRILTTMRQATVGETQVCLGEVDVTTQVVGFQKRAHFTDQPLGEEPLQLPAQQFRTVALWFGVPETLLATITQQRLDMAGGLHAAEHAAIGVLPLFALCDRNDIGGVSTPLHPDTGKPQVFIYDGHAGGIGIAEKGYELIRELWSATLRLVEACPCESGCPGCIQSPKCGNNNEPLDKQVALLLLRALLQGGKV